MIKQESNLITILQQLKDRKKQIEHSLALLKNKLRDIYQEQIKILSNAKECEKEVCMRIRDMKEIEEKIESYTICQCGHLRKEHGPARSINYTEGMCLIKGCKCQNYITCT